MNNFNIQLFAETPLNSTTTMTPEMKTFYEKRLIDQAEPRLVHRQKMPDRRAVQPEIPDHRPIHPKIPDHRVLHPKMPMVSEYW